MDVDEGFACWYRAQHAGVVRALAAVIGDVDEAGEAADEAFARALERWPQVSATLHAARRRLAADLAPELR